MSNPYSDLAKQVIKNSEPVLYDEEDSQDLIAHSVGDVSVILAKESKKISAIHFTVLGVEFVYTQNEICIIDIENDEVRTIIDTDLKEHISEFILWRTKSLESFSL